MPERIQRQRTKGWRMPEGAVYVGRPTRWGNPFRYGREYSMPGGWRRIYSDEAVALFAVLLRDHPIDLEPLRGRDLACWCPLDQPCHADVLLELANR